MKVSCVKIIANLTEGKFGRDVIIYCMCLYLQNSYAMALYFKSEKKKVF